MRTICVNAGNIVIFVADFNKIIIQEENTWETTP